ERAIAGIAIEERLAAACCASPVPERAGSAGVHVRLAVPAHERYAVVLARGSGADFALEHIQRDQLRLALERIAPPTPALRLDAQERAGRDGLVVHEPGQDTLVRPPGIDRHAEGRSRLAAAQAPAREDGAVGDAQKCAVAEPAKVIDLAPATA